MTDGVKLRGSAWEGEARSPSEDSAGRIGIRERLERRGERLGTGNWKDDTVLDIDRPSFEGERGVRARGRLDCDVNVVGIVCLDAIALSCHAADVDGPMASMLIEHDLGRARQTRITGFAETMRITTAQAIGAVVSLVEADDVLRPQPHKIVGREVMPDDNLRGVHANTVGLKNGQTSQAHGNAMPAALLMTKTASQRRVGGSV